MRIFTLFITLFFTGTAAMADGGRQKSEVIVPEGWEGAYNDWGYAPAVKTEDGTIYVSGVVSRLRGEGSYEEQYAAGFKAALETIDNILKEGGASLDDVVELMTFHTDLARQIETAVKARMEVMNPPHPAWTAVGTTALVPPLGVTEIRVVAKIAKD